MNTTKIFAMTVKETQKELKKPETQILWSQWVRISTDSTIKLQISKHYSDFAMMFNNVEDKHALLKHQKWDHKSAKNLSERKPTKRLYTEIAVISWILNTVHTQIKQIVEVMHWVLSTQQYYNKEQLPAITHIEIAELISRSAVIHKV